MYGRIIYLILISFICERFSFCQIFKMSTGRQISSVNLQSPWFFINFWPFKQTNIWPYYILPFLISVDFIDSSNFRYSYRKFHFNAKAIWTSPKFWFFYCRFPPMKYSITLRPDIFQSHDVFSKITFRLRRTS